VIFVVTHCESLFVILIFFWPIKPKEILETVLSTQTDRPGKISFYFLFLFRVNKQYMYTFVAVVWLVCNFRLFNSCLVWAGVAQLNNDKN
jgi:hypothetical protein